MARTNDRCRFTRSAAQGMCGIVMGLCVLLDGGTLFNGAVSQATADEPKPSDSPQPAAPDAGKEKPVPLNLKPFINMKAQDFDKNKVYPWKVVPTGAQTYANIPLQIDGTIMLWGEANTKRGMIFRENVVGIPVKQSFETLYVYHGSFFEGTKGEPTYAIVFNYDDGTSSHHKILNGIDVRDWYGNRMDENFGPTGERSVLAWDGDHVDGARKQAIRFCLTAVDNPYPERQVLTIDLLSSRKRTAGCILALTAGKSGLMRRTPEPEPKTGE